MDKKGCSQIQVKRPLEGGFILFVMHNFPSLRRGAFLLRHGTYRDLKGSVTIVRKGKNLMEQKRELAIKMLTDMSEKLDGRLPKRSDFTGEEVCFIKQKLGPWPRALEEAGLKERKGPAAAEKSRAKRARIKRNAKLRE